jgi:hypothetical protein
MTDIACGGPAPATGAEIQILDACGLNKDESAYREFLIPGAAVAGYAPLFGSMFTISGFHAAVAALMLKRQRVYAAPVPDNPSGIAVCRETAATPLQNAFCTQTDCVGTSASIHLDAS